MQEAIGQMAVVRAQGANEQQQTALQGIVDSMQAAQDHHHAQMEQLLKGHLEVQKAKAQPKPKPTKPA